MDHRSTNHKVAKINGKKIAKERESVTQVCVSGTEVYVRRWERQKVKQSGGACFYFFWFTAFHPQLTDGEITAGV